MRISDWSSDVCSSDLIAGRQHAIERHVRAHDVAGAGVDRGLERRQIDVPQFAVGQLDLIVVTTAERRAVTGEMLGPRHDAAGAARSEEHTSELQSLMRISYAVFCLKKKKDNTHTTTLR